MECSAQSNKGSSRKNNEDAYYANDSEKFFIVADGVGGAANGEFASNNAISKAVDYLKSEHIPQNADAIKVEGYLQKSISLANEYIINIAKSDVKYNGMGTTFVLVYIDGGKAYFANLGDSRAYLIREGKITQITNDHTIAAELARKGEITYEELLTHPRNNIITKAIGMNENIEAEMHNLIISKDDIIVLCSDGVYNVVADNEILSIFSKDKNMQESCEEVMRKIESRQGKDDNTILAVKVRGDL